MKEFVDRHKRAQEKRRKWAKLEEKAIEEMRARECAIWRNRYTETLKSLDAEKQKNRELQQELEREKEEKEVINALLLTMRDDLMKDNDWKEQCHRARSQLSEVSAICTAKEDELDKVTKELEDLKTKTKSDKYQQLMKAMQAFTKEGEQ